MPYAGVAILALTGYGLQLFKNLYRGETNVVLLSPVVNF